MGTEMVPMALWHIQIVTMVTVAGTLLLVPLVLAALNLPKEWGVSLTVEYSLIDWHELIGWYKSIGWDKLVD